MFRFQQDGHARHQNENSARKCRTDIAQLPTTWERPALRHRPSQAIAISRIGLWGRARDGSRIRIICLEGRYSTVKLLLHKKARQEKKKLALLFTFTTI